MKTLLVAINSKYIHSNPAVYSLKAYAACFDVSICEYTINQDPSFVLEDILLQKAEVVAFSCYIWNIEFVREVARNLHAVNPDIRIWMGGPEVSYYPETIYEELPFVELIMVGEGEETFRELLEGEKPLPDIRGLALPGGVFTGERPKIALARLPFLYENVETFNGRILYYESIRGCPYHCAYCLSAEDCVTTAKELQQVFEELSAILDQKPALVKFVDRTFNCFKQYATEIWKFLKENDNGVTCFHFEVAADLIDEEQLAILKTMRPGLIQLEIGVQSTNPETLKEIHRNNSIDAIRDASIKIHSYRTVHIHLDLIAGLPYENLERFIVSFNEVFAMQPDQLQLGFLKVLKGTPMYDMAEKHGIVYEAKPPYEVLKTAYMSYEDLRLLKRVSDMVEIFYNSGQFKKLVEAMLRYKYSFSPFLLFKDLAEFYRDRGYEINTPARSRRYEVFLEWALGLEGMEAHRQELVLLALYDMYARENLKSRPDWAQPVGHETEIRAFYEREAAEPKLLSGYSGMTSKQLARQTHIEKAFEEGCYYLFDYSCRNPLSQDAEVHTLWLRKGELKAEEEGL